jgi:transcription antitermination factor NusA-like protein
MPKAESVESEHYRPGQRIRVVVREVERGANGAKIIVSRAHNTLIERLFELEVPEVATGAVILSSIAREPGYRTKVAVDTRQEGVDPVGSCVGLRGARIQNIVNELNGEKIDVIPWNSDPSVYIAQALSPSQVTKVEVLGEKRALVVVPDSQLSLAIGKEGQNARLAAKLTGWRIDIRSGTEILVAEGEIVEPDATLLTPEEEESITTDENIDAVANSTETVVEVAESSDQISIEQPDSSSPDPDVAIEDTLETESDLQKTDEVTTDSSETTVNDDDIEKALKELELEEAALNETSEETSDDEDGPEESFDFDEFLKDYQADNETGGQGIRFAEDIFPEKGGRFKDGRSGGGNNRGGGQSGGRRGGGR